MARNGSGTYTLPQPAFVPNTTISSSAVNSDLSDIASALTASVAADGQTTITGQLKFPAGTAAAPSHTFAVDLTTGMYYVSPGIFGFSSLGTAGFFVDTNHAGVGKDGNVLYTTLGPGLAAAINPVGMVTPFAGSTAPIGWFLCAGQSFVATNYPELFQVIGTTYGGTSANPLVPDFRGRTPAGVDNMGGSAANRITNALSGIVGTTLGAVGGSQTLAIGQANLPNIAVTATSGGTFSGSSSNVSPNYVTPTTATTATGSGPSAVGPSAGTTGTTTAAGTISVTTTMAWPNIGQGGGTTNMGSGTALGSAANTKLDPTIMLNYIIFAGRP